MYYISISISISIYKYIYIYIYIYIVLKTHLFSKIFRSFCKESEIFTQ